MMFKTALSLFASAVLLSTTAMAANNLPEQCPSTDVIKSVGFYDVYESEESLWLGFNTDNYGTDTMWTFVFGLIDADTPDEARLDGSKWLQMLGGNPEPVNVGGVYGCEYELPGGLAIAVVEDGQNALYHFRSFPRK